MAPKPAPFDIHDWAAVARYAREGFRNGLGMRALSAELTGMGVRAANGGAFRECDVKALLLRYPRVGPYKRAA
jgi:hypothetical protein